jgi:hypothetical protein
VSHVVLSLWFDTFDFADNFEYPGIVINGSKHSAPRIDPKFLGSVLVKIIDESKEKGRGILARAKGLAKVMDRYKG